MFSVTHQWRREPVGEGRSPKPASASEFGIVGHRRPILLRRRDIARAAHIPLRLHLLIEVQVKLSIDDRIGARSEEHTSALKSLMRISYPVFCLTNTNTLHLEHNITNYHIPNI